MQPVLSVCIPTFNRADVLAYALGGLRELERFGLPFEVVISDNLSTDGTAEMVGEWTRTAPYVRFIRQSRALPVSGGLINATRNARGKYVVFHADDDSIIAETLVNYVARMEMESDLSAIFADWIAFDDARGLEMHRYFKFPKPAAFPPSDPLGLVEFVLRNYVYPEVAVYRREALLLSQCLVRRGDYFAHLWMYQLSRLGRVAFELEPFYREHRVLKPEFRRRERWSNWSMRMHLIGDEMRNELEAVVLLALQDAGVEVVSLNQQVLYRWLIDEFLAYRLGREVYRAIEEKDWLLALELQRRWVVWHGSGPEEEQKRVLDEISFPAALQHVHELYRTLSDVTGLALRGFNSRRVHDFFARHYPEVELLDPVAGAAAAGPGRPLVVDKHAPTGDGERDAPPEHPEYRVSLERLLQCYRVNAHPIDLTEI